MRYQTDREGTSHQNGPQSFPDSEKPHIDQSLANRLLAFLRPAERSRLLSRSEWVELDRQQMLGRAGERISHVYFPTNSIVSLLSNLHGARNYGLSQLGFEGMLGASVGSGVSVCAFDAVVSGAGQAWRIRLDVWREQCLASRSLRILSARYQYAQLSQMGTMVACAHFHSLAQRLARLLLASATQLRTPDIQMTHSGLAQLLGVRRAGVTVAAGTLQERGVIRYARGHILVLDRQALLAQSCGCYLQNVRTYEQVMSGSLGPLL